MAIIYQPVGAGDGLRTQLALLSTGGVLAVDWRNYPPRRFGRRKKLISGNRPIIETPDWGFALLLRFCSGAEASSTAGTMKANGTSTAMKPAVFTQAKAEQQARSVNQHHLQRQHEAQQRCRHHLIRLTPLTANTYDR